MVNYNYLTRTLTFNPAIIIYVYIKLISSSPAFTSVRSRHNGTSKERRNSACRVNSDEFSWRKLVSYVEKIIRVSCI